jgi:hypothetical protein
MFGAFFCIKKLKGDSNTGFTGKRVYGKAYPVAVMIAGKPAYRLSNKGMY